MDGRIQASVTVLTYDSARTIGACLRSVSRFSDILVLDGGSTDGTVDIARAAGARILPQADIPGPIKDFTAVRERSFSLATHSWIFVIDADERADTVLVDAIAGAVAVDDQGVAYRVERVPVVEGKEIRRSSFSPDRIIRLAHRGSAGWRSGKRVHERLEPAASVRVTDLAGKLLTDWPMLSASAAKDRYYLALAFSRPLTHRPAFGTTIRSVSRNTAFALRIAGEGAWLCVRHRGAADVLPFRYHIRFARYHAAVAWERLRQFFLGTSYAPPVR